MGAAKLIVGIAFAIIGFTFAGIVISNGLKEIEDAEKWLAYEYGVCRFIDGWSEQRYLAGGYTNIIA